MRRQQTAKGHQHQMTATVDRRRLSQAETLLLSIGTHKMNSKCSCGEMITLFIAPQFALGKISIQAKAFYNSN